MTENKKLDPFERVGEIITKYEKKEIRDLALSNLNIMKEKQYLPMGKPSAIAGALIYYSRGKEKVYQANIVQFLQRLDFDASEATIRKHCSDIAGVLKHGL
jgi:hypothetical protein